jgi:hypothetical protein
VRDAPAAVVEEKLQRASEERVATFVRARVRAALGRVRYVRRVRDERYCKMPYACVVGQHEALTARHGFFRCCSVNLRCGAVRRQTGRVVCVCV